MKTLERFGFGQTFIKWVKIINHNTVSCINYNGKLSIGEDGTIIQTVGKARPGRSPRYRAGRPESQFL